MAKITLKGTVLNTSGELPAVGSQGPDFSLTSGSLSPKALSDYAGKRVILNIFPSIDTGTCAASVRRFNQEAAGLQNTVVLCISKDLPFAQSRFCGAEGIENVEALSDFKNDDFSKAYGLRIEDGPLAGLLSRSVVVLDENAVVKYTEQVAEVTEEPNYEAALAALS